MYLGHNPRMYKKNVNSVETFKTHFLKFLEKDVSQYTVGSGCFLLFHMYTYLNLFHMYTYLNLFASLVD